MIRAKWIAVSLTVVVVLGVAGFFALRGPKKPPATPTGPVAASSDRKEELASLINLSIIINRAGAEARQMSQWVDFAISQSVLLENDLPKSDIMHQIEDAEDAHKIKYGEKFHGLRSFPANVIKAQRELNRMSDSTVDLEISSAKLHAAEAMRTAKGDIEKRAIIRDSAFMAKAKISKALIDHEVMFTTMAKIR